MTAAAGGIGRHRLAVAVETVRQHRFVLGACLVALVVPFVPLGIELQVPLVWVLQFVVFPHVDLRWHVARIATSLQAGLALAWLTLAACVLDFREHHELYRHWNPTGVPGCQVMALLGFPIRGIGGHGGGGWRLWHHLPSDPLVHLGNVLSFAVGAWLLLGWLPARGRRAAYWCAFALLPIAFVAGYERAMWYWD